MLSSLLFLLLALQSGAYATGADAGTETALIITGTLTGLFVVLIFFVIFVMHGEIDAVVEVLKRSWAYVAAKPVEEVKTFDEDFDGISELDNRIPPWFNYLFAATVVFAVFYWLNYHVWGTSPLPQAEYSQELASADILRRVRIASEGTINEDQLTVLTDPAILKEAAERFQKNCSSCHGPQGGGLVGPNLADAYWIHGGGIKNIYATIKNGVPAKGMISWKLVFTPKEMQQLASYIISLKGTRPSNPKKPEGDLYVEPPAAPADTTITMAKS
jgi:cytochrome c oxidase cbb3-type subunit 3